LRGHGLSKLLYLEGEELRQGMVGKEAWIPQGLKPGATEYRISEPKLRPPKE
jgi:hypothetical protein